LSSRLLSKSLKIETQKNHNFTSSFVWV